MASFIAKTNGNNEVVQPLNGTDFKLAELQKIVGGYVEIVQLNEHLIMVVNEEGKLHGLPINPFATLIYQAYTLNNDDVIVGDALICETEQVK